MGRGKTRGFFGSGWEGVSSQGSEGRNGSPIEKEEKGGRDKNRGKRGRAKDDYLDNGFWTGGAFRPNERTRRKDEPLAGKKGHRSKKGGGRNTNDRRGKPIRGDKGRKGISARGGVLRSAHRRPMAHEGKEHVERT